MRDIVAATVLVMLVGLVEPASSVAATAPTGRRSESVTHTFYGHGRCTGRSWIMESIYEPKDPRVRTIKTDTDGDGVIDRIESWVVTKSHPLRDRAGRRDGWVAQGTHSLLTWNFELEIWNDIIILDKWPVEFKLTCKRVRR